MDTAQYDLLNTVQLYIGQKACKRYNYSRVGRDIAFLTEDIMALRNFEFLLCGRDLTCDEIDCVACSVAHLKN